MYQHELRGPGFNTRGQAIGTSAAMGGSFGLLGGIILPRERWKGVPVPKAP